MRKILISQFNNEQVPMLSSHISNIRRINSDPAETQSRSATDNRISFTSENTETGQITSFFAVRKRRTSEESISLLNGKKTKAYGALDPTSISSSRLVPCCNFFDDKENALENVVQVVPDAVSNTSLGFFEMLPPELLYVMFDNIPVLQLKQLCLSSSTLNAKVCEYISMASTRRRFFTETGAAYYGDFESAKDPFYAWGMLLKACSIVMSFHSSHVFLAKFFIKNKKIDNWCGWGRCFMAIRARLRGFFLSCWEKNDESYGFWISLILRTQKTISQQGQLFMIIFGPLKLDDDNCEVIDWDLLSNTSIEDRRLCEEIIGPMSFSIHCMVSNENLMGYAWSDYHIFNLIEEITTAPHSWTLDNFAALLALRPKLIHIALHARIIHGHQEEAAHLFHAINSVLHQWGIFSSTAVTGVLLKTFRALSDIRRRLFLSSFLRTESELLSDALMNEPFDRDYFYMELAVGRAVSPLVTLMASNV
uniref:Bm9207 n=1 Tax=Brugia malayi TaxID=6279 RepID=A0A0J9Y717_BRUMA|nr:Bm9207 [Brugia malayi]